jgi:HEPN domain-containing protein
LPPDPARIEDVKAWLRKAGADMRAAEHDLRASPPLFEDAVFHCQQAAEKALKGFLAWHDRPFRKSHDIEEIGSGCSELDLSLKPIIDRAVPLTEYAWKFRYPGETDKLTQAEVHEALSLAREVYKAILTRLPEEARP